MYYFFNMRTTFLTVILIETDTWTIGPCCLQWKVCVSHTTTAWLILTIIYFLDNVQKISNCITIYHSHKLLDLMAYSFCFSVFLRQIHQILKRSVKVSDNGVLDFLSFFCCLMSSKPQKLGLFLSAGIRERVATLRGKSQSLYFMSVDWDSL